jgi:hypothetical protein
MDTNIRSRRARHRKGCRRNRKLHGGGSGTSYGFGASVDPTNPSLGNAAEVKTFASCQEATRPGYLAGATIQGGLPGFGSVSQRGGRSSKRSSRRNRSRRSTRRNRMVGGVYGFNPTVVGPNNVSVPGRPYTGCGEGAYAVQNPLNQGNFPASVLTAPPAGTQRGGAGPPSFDVDAMRYNVPRSGYSDGPSSGATSAGPPFLIHTPYSAQPVPSPACVKTGGGYRRKTRKSRKGSRKSRKNKNSRKSRKSRKNKKSCRN